MNTSRLRIHDVRVFESPSGSSGMPRTTQCSKCGIILNLPDSAAGKRLKCPKCGNKFAIGPDTSEYPITERSDHDASAASSITLPQGGHGDLSLPTASGDLRDTFELPLLGEADAAPGQAKSVQAADVLALFEQK